LIVESFRSLARDIEIVAIDKPDHVSVFSLCKLLFPKFENHFLSIRMVFEFVFSKITQFRYKTATEVDEEFSLYSTFL